MINDENIEFNSSNVFTALALFNQLTVPLFIFPITIPIIISSLISTRRIERFLSQPEVEKEFEGVKHMARVLSKNNDLLDDDPKTPLAIGENEKLFQISRETIIDEEEMEEKEKITAVVVEESQSGNKNVSSITEEVEDEESQQIDMIMPTNDVNDDVVILRNKNNRVKLRKQNQLSESARIERNRIRSTTAVDKHKNTTGIHRLPSFKVPDGIAVCINNAQFSWSGRRESKNILQIEKLSIPLGMVQSFLFLLSNRKKPSHLDRELIEILLLFLPLKP